MSDIDKHIDDFVQRGLDYLQQKRKGVYDQVREKLKLFQTTIEEGNDGMAVGDWGMDFKTPNKTVVPSMLKYGDLRLKIDDNESLLIPFLLPTSVNAVLFDVGDDSERIPNLFQNIILRVLLTLKMNLVKVSIVDKDFGSSFSFMSTLKNPAFKKHLIYEDESITKLITSLAKEASEANRDFLGQYADLDTYNAQSGQLAHPYHFVFIDDFPKGFSPQAVDGLLSLIEHGNALKAGIKIFINYSKRNPAPYDFNLSRFENTCACLSNVNGSLVLKNWQMQFPPNVTPTLEIDLPENAGKVSDFINSIKYKETGFSLDDWIEELKSSNEVWSGNSTDGISVPVGFVNPMSQFEFELARGNKDFFALITGQPGCGKSVLLKNIVVNAAMKYSPEELCFYLADFSSGGITFSIFEKLPHVKALMMADNREYVVRMFQDILKETDRRSDLFQEAQDEYYGSEVSSLSAYRKVTGKTLPRIVLIIDEFQVLFQNIDPTQDAACLLLSRAIREWRKFGISIILSTQTLTNVRFTRDVDDNITYRFAMMEEEAVSKATIGNDAAKNLTRPGQVIMNNSRGDMAKNVEFQAAFSDNYILQVGYLADKYRETYSVEHEPYLCKRGTGADIASNQVLVDMLKEQRENNRYCFTYIGKPDLLRKEHTRILYGRQPNSNTLLIGNDNKTLVFDVITQLVQLKMQSLPNSKFYIVDCFNYGDKFKGALDVLPTLSDSFVVMHSENMETVMGELEEELNRRKTAQRLKSMVEERAVLVVLNAQNCDALKPIQDRFTKPSDSTQKLTSILSEGSPLGIHCIIHAFSYISLFKSSGIFESKEKEYFANIIALKGADMDNMFIGNSVLSKMGMNKPGRMIVINGELDGESYEQCNAYSKSTVKEHSKELDFVSQIFTKYHDVR